MEKLTLREELAKVNYECFVGLPWENATEDEKQGAYGHADKLLEIILARMFNQEMCYCHEKASYEEEQDETDGLGAEVEQEAEEKYYAEMESLSHEKD